MLLATLAAALLVAPVPARAQTALPAQMNRFLDEQAALGFSGTILVAHKGEVARRAYGAADLELGVANTPEMRFRIGSLTKQFTAGAMLLLEQDGLLSLDDPLCKYVDPCPTAWKPIRLKQLLNHSSGIPDFVRLPGMRERFTTHMELPQIIDIIRDQPLAFTPGSDASYGNSGFLLSAYVIQKVSGQTYADFLRKRLYEPLGMVNSGYADDATIIPNRVHGYVRRDGRFENAPFIDMAIPIGAGSQYSTIDDLYRWDRALRQPGLFTAQSLAKMFEPGRGDFGLGWEVSDEGGRRVIEHNGDINGFGAFIARYPDDDAAIVILTNVEGTKVRQMKDEIAKRLFATN